MSEWVSVLFSGCLWGGVMALMNAFGNPQIKTLKGGMLFVFEYMSAGLLFGILVTFHWHQAVHPPLVFFTVAAFAGMIISGLSIRKQKSEHTEPEEQNPLTIPQHLR